jgi:hypothetical protein
LTTNVGAEDFEVLGRWKCIKQCALGPAPLMLISEHSDGTLVFYANLLSPGLLYRDIADGHWIAPDTIALTGILGPWFKRVKSVRVRSGVLAFEDGTEWRPEVPYQP